MSDFLDRICPLHVVLEASGHIIHAGPMVRKIDDTVTGQCFFEWVEVRRPVIPPTAAALMSLAGHRLHLTLRKPRRIDLKGILLVPPVGDGLCPDGGAIVNLSFGYALPEAVNAFDLRNNDFAPTDLAIEMLYLIEAKSAAMEAARKMAMRSQGARVVAEEQAFTDALTGLKNRRALDAMLIRLTESRCDFALMHCDLDYFKAVNDTLGHAAGDAVLQNAARIMVVETRDEDSVIRLGGDEFVLILPGLGDPEKVTALADRLIARLEEPFDYMGTPCRISASIGTTLSCYYDQPEPARMIGDADLALYAAKKAGRGKCYLFTPGIC